MSGFRSQDSVSAHAAKLVASAVAVSTSFANNRDRFVRVLVRVVRSLFGIGFRS